MRARVYCAHPSTRDYWALRCMSRCPDQVVSLKRDSQCLSPQASLVLINRPTAVGMKEMNQTCFQNIEEWSEANITGNKSFQLYFLTYSQVNLADVKNYDEFLSKEMPDIKIDDNCVFEVERRLNV
ncbi:hypothetical protein TNCV_1780081 [Trichonephila clavipes]|nr:hypothetical protein TNCV_1780081 [Trichonephila clavipes]